MALSRGLGLPLLALGLILSVCSGCGGSSGGSEIPDGGGGGLVPVSDNPPPGGTGASPVVGMQTVTTSDAMVTVMDGPDDKHQVTLDTRLYLPANATAATPRPAVLMTNGFGLNKLSDEITSMADFLARHGYVVLTYTGQGFGASTGCIRLDSFDYDVKDSMRLIDKVLDDPAFKVGDVSVSTLVARDAKGPLVGLIGGSYGGGIVVNAAATDPRVRAAIPGRTWNSLQFALDPNNVVSSGDTTGFTHQLSPQGVFKQQWTSLFFASGNAEPAQGHGTCPQEKAASGDPTMVGGAACAGYPSALCQVFASLSGTGDIDDAGRDLIKGSSVATRIDQLRVPTMLVQGQSDTLFNENDAAATYTALKAAGVPVAMIWNSGGHGGYNSLPGECEVYGGGNTGLDACYLTLRALAWFDRWLKGDTTVDTGPGFAYYRDWAPYDNSGSAYSQYGQAASYPSHPAQTFYLSGSTDLVTDAAKAVAGSAMVINPAGGMPASYTETSNQTGPNSSPSVSATPPSDPPQQIASFTSAAFTRDVVSVGVPMAHLKLSHVNTRDLVFYGKVWDVNPDGTATLIHRLIAPVRVPAADVAKPIDIRLLGFAHKFQKDHKVRFSIASTDQTSYNAKVADVITVATGGTDPATFSLPVDGPL